MVILNVSNISEDIRVLLRLFYYRIHKNNKQIGNKNIKLVKYDCPYCFNQYCIK